MSGTKIDSNYILSKNNDENVNTALKWLIIRSNKGI